MLPTPLRDRHDALPANRFHLVGRFKLEQALPGIQRPGSPSQYDANPVVLCGEDGAELAAAGSQVGQRVGLVGRAPKDRFVIVVVAHEAQIAIRSRSRASSTTMPIQSSCLRPP